MKKLINYIVSAGAVALLLVAVVGLNIAIQNHNETTTTSSSETATRLNIAIVNEDKAVVSGNNTYNLGNSYIKKLEKDDSQNWSVVTRGTADSGDYQLIVVIPSDFSAKTLDLNSLSAEPATISYEVKADGNQQIEIEATKVGKDIVSDLNNQLVNMYIASILSNLYTAQQNVQAMANQQSGNIASYRTSVFDSAVNFENNFPSLVAAANGSSTANDALIQSLSSFASLYSTLDSSQQTFHTDLMSLVVQRATDGISYQEFASALLAVDADTLSIDLATMTNLLQDVQSQLEETVSSVSSSATSGATSDVQDQVDSLTEQITTLENQFAEQLKVLQEQRDNIKQFAAAEVAKYYNGSSNFTVGDLFNQKKASDGSSYFAMTTDSYRSSLQSTTSIALNQLPAIDQNGINSVVANMTSLDATAADSLANFSTDLAGTFSSAFSYTPSTLATELAAAKAALENAKSEFESEEQATTNAVTSASADSSKTTVTAQVSLTLPSRAGFVLDSWSYNGTSYSGSEIENVKVTLSDSSSSANSFTFSYHYDSTATTMTTSSSESDIISVQINGVTGTSASTVDLTSYQAKVQAYRTAESAYAAKVQEVKDAYSNAQTLLSQYYTTDSFLNQSVIELLTDMVATAITNNLTNYASNSATTTESIKQQIEALKAKRDTIASQLASLQGSSQAMNDSLLSQLDTVQALQKQISDLKLQETSISSALNDSDSSLNILASTLSSLLSSTSELKSISESNVDEANQVSALFSSFGNDMESAQSNSHQLATEAQDLMAQFDEELEESGDFVGSFVKVLNNAYSDGVANEVLLDFLASPVTESSSSVNATVNVYRPFTWILLLEIITLFVAYIFATYTVIQKVKDKFSINKLQKTDILNTAVIALLATIIGVVLGGVFASRLSVESEFVPSWVLIVTLFSLLLTQGQYLLIKNFKAFGMGINLFMIISFVYLSNAIGTTAILSGLPAVLKGINALSILEGTLSSYFDGQSASLLLVLGLMVAVLVFSAMNIFITLNWQTLLQKTAKAEV